MMLRERKVHDELGFYNERLCRVNGENWACYRVISACRRSVSYYSYVHKR